MIDALIFSFSLRGVDKPREDPMVRHERTARFDRYLLRVVTLAAVCGLVVTSLQAQDRRPTKVSDSAPQKVQHDLIKFFV